jgi:ADP-heptose:LPS heptosyltransferase
VATRLVIDLSLLLLPKRCDSNAAGIVRLDAIGDFVIWLPTAKALVAHLRISHERVVLIANQLWAPWAAKLLDVDEVLQIDTGRMNKEISYRLEVMRRVRSLRLGTIICPTFSRIPGDGNDAVVFASSARCRIGNFGYRSRSRMAYALRLLLNLGYSRVVLSGDKSNSGIVVNEAENNATFLVGLGLAPTSLIGNLSVADDVELDYLKLPDEPYVVLIPGGSFSAKAWPVERFAEVGRALKKCGLEVVVSGSGAEHALCERLSSACGGRNIAGKTSLPVFAEVIRHARLVIGNDSASIHIAVATRTDSLCVMWGGSFGRFIPYAPALLPKGVIAHAVYKRMDCFGCTGDCPLPPVDGKVPCIDAIPVSAILSSLNYDLNVDVTTGVYKQRNLYIKTCSLNSES